jgi:hypothetical protein
MSIRARAQLAAAQTYFVDSQSGHSISRTRDDAGAHLGPQMLSGVVGLPSGERSISRGPCMVVKG